ncbi:MAG: hypothetical protein ACI4UC_08690 [Alloprevotella sp.]
MSNTTLSPAKNTALSPRELSAAIYRLSDDSHAHADFALLKTLDPSTANDPQFTFSPRRYHPHILRALLALTTEQEILAARKKPPQAKKATVPRSFAARPQKATVPGDSVAGQSPANQKKTPSQKSKNTPKSTGKTSSTLTPSQQSSSTTTVSPPTGE